MTARWDLTWRLLVDWADGQARSERLAAQLMHEAGFQDIDPAHPLGGPDGGADALMRRGGELWAMAVHFPHGRVAATETRRKAAADAASAACLGAAGMAFVTNQPVTKGERDRIAGDAGRAGVRVDVYHLERIAGMLDRPSMAGVRDRYLGAPATAGPPAALQDAAVRRVAAALPSTGRAWLVVAVAGEAPARGEEDGRLTVARARALVDEWRAAHGPVAALDLTTDAHRDEGRVVLTGVRAAAPPPKQSTWRIEVGDDGSVVLAAALPHALRAEGGSPAWQGMPGEVVLDAELVVPVRRDALELWAFTGLHLALCVRPSILAGQGGRPASAAAVLVPPAARLRGHHHVLGSSMTLVDPSPDPDRPGGADRPSPSGRPLPLQEIRADATVCAEGPSGRAAAAAARRLAVLVEERFGVEEPLLLGVDGGLRARLAAPEDQQAVHQYARACGLPVEPRSPVDLRANAARAAGQLPSGSASTDPGRPVRERPSG